MTDNTETIPILVTLGHVGDGSLNLRFPPEYEAQILPLLDENGIEHDTILEFSAGQELWIEAIRVLNVPGGLAALAAVYKTIVHRHDGKRFVLRRGGDEIEAAGYSEKKVEHLLQEIAAEQAQRDAE